MKSDNLDDIIKSSVTAILVTPLHAEFWLERDMVCRITNAGQTIAYYIAWDHHKLHYDLMVNLGWTTLTVATDKSLESILHKIPFQDHAEQGPLEIMCRLDVDYERIRSTFAQLHLQEEEPQPST
jgi:hypothetical protein